MVGALSLKIGVSGVRGVVGESLTPQLVTSFAAAFGTYCGAGPVTLGTDTRPSREMVAQAAIAGLLSVGCAPVDVGIVPAPTLQLQVRRTEAVGGICVTASHNPTEWNALKFFGADGIVLRPNQFAELLDLYHQGTYPRVGSESILDISSDDGAVDRHVEAVLAVVDVGRIRAQRFRVAVDCCNGAAYRAAPDFLRTLGCTVVELHTDPALPFPRNPEPVASELGDLGALVLEEGADVGFALDADADRLAVVDERGDPLGEECTVALSVRHILARSPGPVVVSMSTSRMIDDIARTYGCVVHRARVGEIHVLERMFETGAAVGGEGNGGVIVPSINPCRDSFVAMALILEALAAAGGRVSELRGQLPVYSMVKEKVACRARDVPPLLRVLRYLYADEVVDLTDGVKVIWPDRWLHVRGSNTEAVLRVAAEAPREEDARALVRGVLEYVRPAR